MCQSCMIRLHNNVKTEWKMEDDIDIYEDLPSFNIEDNENYAKKNKELVERCAELEKQVLELSAQLKSVQDVKHNLEVNLSSLLKTAKAEVTRKDRMLGEMKTKFENLAFKRGEYSRISTAHRRRSPERHARGNDPNLERCNKPKIPEIPETPEVICEEPSSHHDVEEKDIKQLHHQPFEAAMTVYQERLRKRILEEQESERKQREAARAKCDDNPISAGKPITTVVNKEIELKNNNNDKENQSESVKLDRNVESTVTTKIPLSCFSSGSSVSQENCGFPSRKSATLLVHSNRKRTGDQTDRDDSKKRVRLDDSKVKYKDDSRNLSMARSSNKTVDESDSRNRRRDFDKREAKCTKADDIVFDEPAGYQIPDKGKVKVKDDIARPSSKIERGSDSRHCTTDLDKRDGKRTDSNRDDDKVFDDPDENRIPDKDKVKIKDDIARPSNKTAKGSDSRHCKTDLDKRDGKRTDSNRGDKMVFDDPDENQIPGKYKNNSRHTDIVRPSSKIIKVSDSCHCRTDLDKREAKFTNANRDDDIVFDGLDEYEVVDEYKSSPPPSASVDHRNECDKKSDIHSDGKTSETHNRLASRLMLLASGIDPDQRGSSHSDGVQCNRSNCDKRQNNRSDGTNSRSRSKSRERDSRQSRRRRSRTRSPERRYSDSRYNKNHSSRYRSNKDKFTTRRNLKNKDADNLSEFSREIHQLKEKIEHRLDDDRDGDQNENSMRSRKRGDRKGRVDQNSVADKSRSSSNEKILLRRSERSKSRETRSNRSPGRNLEAVAHSVKHSESEVIRNIEEENAAIVDKKESLTAENPDNTSLMSLEDGEILDTPGSSPMKKNRVDENSLAELEVPSAIHSTELEERCKQINEEISPRASLRLENTHSSDEFLFKEKMGLPERKSVRSRSLIDDVNTSIEEKIENIEKFIKNYSTLEGPDAKRDKTNDPGITVEDIVEANKRVDTLTKNDPILDTKVKNTTENIQNILSMESETEIHKLLVAVENDLNNPSTEWKLVEIDEDSKTPTGFWRTYKKSIEQPGATSKQTLEEKSEVKQSKTVCNKIDRSALSLKKTIAKNKPVLNSLRLRSNVKNQTILPESCTGTSDVPSDDFTTKCVSDTSGNLCTKNPDESCLKDADHCRTEISDKYEIGGIDTASSENVDFMSLEDSKRLIPGANEELRVVEEIQSEVLVNLKKENSQLNGDTACQERKMNNIENAASDDHVVNKHESVEDSELKNVCISGVANPELNIGVEFSESKNAKLAKEVEDHVSENENDPGGCCSSTNAEDTKTKNPTLPQIATFDKIESKTVKESTTKNRKLSKVEDSKYVSGPKVEISDKNEATLCTVQQNGQDKKAINSRLQITSDIFPETKILRSLLDHIPEKKSTTVNILAKTKSGSEQTTLPKDSNKSKLKSTDPRGSEIISKETKTLKSKAEGDGTKPKKEPPKVVLTARRRRQVQLVNSNSNVLEVGATLDTHPEKSDSKSVLLNIIEGSCGTVNSATRLNADPKNTTSLQISDRPKLRPDVAERSEEIAGIKKTSKSENCSTKSKNKNCKVVLMARRRRKPVQLEDRTIAITVAMSANNLKTESNMEAPMKRSSPPTNVAGKCKSPKVAQSTISLTDDKRKSFDKSGVEVPECLKPTNSASSSDSINGGLSERDSDSSQETWKP